MLFLFILVALPACIIYFIQMVTFPSPPVQVPYLLYIISNVSLSVESYCLVVILQYYCCRQAYSSKFATFFKQFSLLFLSQHCNAVCCCIHNAVLPLYSLPLRLAANMTSIRNQKHQNLIVKSFSFKCNKVNCTFIKFFLLFVSLS